MNLGIGIPITNRSVDRDFFLSFAAMDKPDRFSLFAPTLEIYSHPVDIAAARNGLVFQALDSECDALIMMDSDQVYPTDTISHLLAGLEHYDAVGAVVHRRKPPFNPLLMRGELGKYSRVSDDEVYSGDLIEIDATGCGCIAYRMSVFQRIDAPWYEIIPRPDNRPVGEDIRFCHKMRTAGMTIGAATNVQVDHLTVFRVDRSTHELFTLLKGDNGHGHLQKR